MSFQFVKGFFKTFFTFLNIIQKSPGKPFKNFFKKIFKKLLQKRIFCGIISNCMDKCVAYPLMHDDFFLNNA